MDTKTKFTREDLVVENKDADPEPTFTCVLCRASGWVGEICHSEHCPLADERVSHVELVSFHDPAKTCNYCKGGGKVDLVEQDSRETVTCPKCLGTGRPGKAQRIAVEDAGAAGECRCCGRNWPKLITCNHCSELICHECAYVTGCSCSN